MNLRVWAAHRLLQPSLLISHLVTESRLLSWQQSSSVEPRKVTLRWKHNRKDCKSKPRKPEIFTKPTFGLFKQIIQADSRVLICGLQCRLSWLKTPFTHFIFLSALFHTSCWLRPHCQAEYTQTWSGCYSVYSGTWEVCKLLVCLALFSRSSAIQKHTITIITPAVSLIKINSDHWPLSREADCFLAWQTILVLFKNLKPMLRQTVPTIGIRRNKIKLVSVKLLNIWICSVSWCLKFTLLWKKITVNVSLVSLFFFNKPGSNRMSTQNNSSIKCELV